MRGHNTLVLRSGKVAATFKRGITLYLHTTKCVKSAGGNTLAKGATIRHDRLVRKK